MAVKSKLPKWATPERRQKLIELFTRSGGFCVFGHKNCLIPEHHYELFIEDLIADWKQADREQREAEWLMTLKAIHSLGEHKYPLRGQFSAISKAIWGDSQPLFYVQHLGISGITLKPFAKVKVPSSYMTLHVNLGDTLRKVGKCKRRKAIRYGKPLPRTIEQEISLIVREAIFHYLTH
jgi:hypothetical protein